MTDVNFYLGKILPEHFPFPLDRGAVEARLAALIRDIEQATSRRYTPVELCDGFLHVANANMVKAIQSISIAKGCDPRDYVLVAFGGAAGQHACAVADDLGIRQVLLHPDAGILSAYGIGVADVVRHAARGVYRPYSDAALRELDPLIAELAAAAKREVLAEGCRREHVEVRPALDLRYQGLDAWLTIPAPTAGTYADAYAEAHDKLYGYRTKGAPLEIVAVRVEVVGHTVAAESAFDACRPARCAARAHHDGLFPGAGNVCRNLRSRRLPPGDCIYRPGRRVRRHVDDGHRSRLARRSTVARRIAAERRRSEHPLRRPARSK